MLVFTGCGPTEPPPRTRAPRLVVEPTQPTPAPRSRKPRAWSAVASWGSDEPVCEPPCTVLPATIDRFTSATQGHSADFVFDGDPETTWCGERGVKDQLLVRFPEPVDLESVGVHAPGVRRIELTTGKWDQVFVTFEPPPEAIDGGAPPYTALPLLGVEVVNVELTHLHESGTPCIAELAFAGVPSRLTD